MIYYLFSLINIKWSHKSTKRVLSQFCGLLQKSQFNIFVVQRCKIMIDQPQDCDCEIHYISCLL